MNYNINDYIIYKKQLFNKNFLFYRLFAHFFVTQFNTKYNRFVQTLRLLFSVFNVKYLIHFILNSKFKSSIANTLNHLIFKCLTFSETFY